MILSVVFKIHLLLFTYVCFVFISFGVCANDTVCALLLTDDNKREILHKSFNVF